MRIHNLSMIAILEPFANLSQLDSYRIQMLMNNGHSNPNSKIWLFCSCEVNCSIFESDQQHITCEVSYDECSEKFQMTYVYAKCKDHLRRPPWDMLKWSETGYPWCINGDFNVISSSQE